MGLPSLKMSRRGFVRAAAFAAVVLAAGAEAIAPSAADELKTVKIFYPPLDFGWTSGYELIEVANAQGYFKNHGLDAQLAVVPWDQYTVALDSGALDFTPFADYAYFINVLDKGLKAKEVVLSTLPFIPEAAGEGLVVRGDGPVKTPADLKGKKIGTQWPSFSGVWFALDWLSKHGVSKDDDTIVPVPQAQLQQVLDQGGVDAIIAYAPTNIDLTRKGYRQLFSVADLVRAYVSAISEAADWANAHPNEADSARPRQGAARSAIPARSLYEERQ
jgi:ABC-type nitrate/sulfonate/bicarbonate transport system substrate-binding protein